MSESWIKCSDRLPENTAEVIVFTFDEFVCTANYLKHLNCWYSDDYNISLENVTHWMPLPEPPRKEVE